MAALAAIFFFSATGLTLNHPDWFFREQTTTVERSMEPAWLKIDRPSPAGWDEVDFGHQVDKLSVVEYLRAEHKIAGRMTEFLTFDDQCEVTFQGPGYAATARIQRDTGKYSLSTTCNDLISILNDLHKGRQAGPVWSWVIDISAIVSALVAFSGFVLVFYLKQNRVLRIATAVVGAVVLLWMILIATS